MRRAAIVSPIRTGVGKYLGSLSSLNAEDLAAIVIKDLVNRTSIDPALIEEVVFAQGYPSGEAPCIGRWAALAADLPLEVSGTQVDRRCGSGVQAIANAARAKRRRRDPSRSLRARQGSLSACGKVWSYQWDD